MRLFHRHTWRAVGVNHLTLYETFLDLPVGTTTTGFRRVETGHQTEVLQRCECSKNRTRTLEGKWTLEQVQGRGREER